jgi:hypothetical protein
MAILGDHPFTKLALPAGEVPVWLASNPAFHRSACYGIVVTQAALYLYSPFWLWLARRRRIALTDIRGVAFCDSRVAPSLRIQLDRGVEVLRTPWDFRDDMNRDRENLKHAVVLINTMCPSLVAQTSAASP